MRTQLRVIAAIAGVSLMTTVGAGSTYVFDREIIWANIGDKGGSYIRAGEECHAEWNGTYYGYGWIGGYIDGQFVNEFLEYFDSCPQIDNTRSVKRNVTNTVSVNGVTVTSVCQDQALTSGSRTAHRKYPDAKPLNTSGQFFEHETYGENAYNGSCVVTAVNASGEVETYGAYARSTGEHYSDHDTRNF